MALQDTQPESVLFLSQTLQEIGDFDTKVIQYEPKEYGIDAILDVNGKEIRIEEKNEVRPEHIYSLQNWIKKLGEGKNVLIVAQYITPRAKNLLKKAGINYLDKAGNIYLSIDNIYIHIERRPNSPPSEKRKNRAFTKAGGCVIFQFLVDPDAVNLRYREIAQRAGVSLGTIPKVIEGLKEEGFVVQMDKHNLKLTKYQELLKRWVPILKDRILPGYELLRCQPSKLSLLEFANTVELKHGTKWGGEQGAQLLTRYLRPEQLSIFTELQKNSLVREYRLKPLEEGPIQVYRKFWHYPNTEEQHVHPVLIYGQLMASGKTRNIETAQMIFDEQIRKLF